MVDSGDDVPMVVRIAHPYRPNLWASLRRIPRDDAHTLCLLQDVTAHRELELQLERTAHEDDLTGVANRATTLRALRTEVARAHRYDRPLAMLLLDVDGLRHVNQAHGTEGGDLVLELVARTLDGCVRGMDFVGRTDADEFAMLLPETDIDGALRLAERVRSSVAGLCVRLPGGMARVTASVGVAIIDVDDDVERLLARAGTAIGQVKLTGGNRVGVAQTRIS
jgi:diguanylate cyclase (GGDEF)-like protein